MGDLMWWWLFAQAWAADPPPADEEITVWGDLAIQKARDAIVADMEAQGWRAKRKSGRIVFHGPRQWMGAAILLDDGTLDFRSPVLGFAPQPSEAWAFEPRTDQAVAGPNDLQTEVGLGPTLRVGSSKRKLAPIRTEVVRSVDDELQAYLAVLRRTAFEEQLLALPDRLDALWKEGVPLQPGPILATPAERREAVLEHWAGRAETPEGQRVCRAIESWLEAVVQESDAAITAEERARFESMRADGRTLP